MVQKRAKKVHVVFEWPLNPESIVWNDYHIIVRNFHIFQLFPIIFKIQCNSNKVFSITFISKRIHVSFVKYCCGASQMIWEWLNSIVCTFLNLEQTSIFISLINCSHVSWLTSLVEKYAFSSYTWMVLIPPHLTITSISCISFSATISLITAPGTLSILSIAIRIAILFRVMETYDYLFEL